MTKVSLSDGYQKIRSVFFFRNSPSGGFLKLANQMATAEMMQFTSHFEEGRKMTFLWLAFTPSKRKEKCYSLDWYSGSRLMWPHWDQAKVGSNLSNAYLINGTRANAHNNWLATLNGVHCINTVNVAFNFVVIGYWKGPLVHFNAIFTGIDCIYRIQVTFTFSLLSRWAPNFELCLGKCLLFYYMRSNSVGGLDYYSILSLSFQQR